MRILIQLDYVTVEEWVVRLKYKGYRVYSSLHSMCDVFDYALQCNGVIGISVC
jgi:hypothetical protein